MIYWCGSKQVWVCLVKLHQKKKKKSGECQLNCDLITFLLRVRRTCMLFFFLLISPTIICIIDSGYHYLYRSFVWWSETPVCEICSLLAFYFSVSVHSFSFFHCHCIWNSLQRRWNVWKPRKNGKKKTHQLERPLFLYVYLIPRAEDGSLNLIKLYSMFHSRIPLLGSFSSSTSSHGSAPGK